MKFKFLVIAIVILLVGVSFGGASNINQSSTYQELDLLRGETIFQISANADVDSFNIAYAIPPNYENQAPIFIEIRNDTTANIISYSMSNDIC